VSGWFVKKLGLPSRLFSAIPASHERTGIRNPIARSVALGSRIAEVWVNPKTVSAMASATELAKNLLELSDSRFDEILEKTAAELPETTRNLEIPLGDESFINGLLDQARQAIAELNIRALQEARQFAIQSQRDALTSLYNRSYLDQVLGVYFNLNRKLSLPLTAIFIDIDDFKKINDTHGHQAGDSVLVSAARVIQSAVREDDTVVRYGGDEFVVLLSKADEDISAKIAERIRSMAEKQHNVAAGGNRIPFTVSVGLATTSSISSISSAAELLEVADRSL